MKRIVMRAVGSVCAWLLLTGFLYAVAGSSVPYPQANVLVIVGVVICAILSAGIVGLAQVAWYFLTEKENS